jgi:large subunit ribosomal protein L21
MYAVIKTGGKQYRVQAGDVLDIEKLDAEKGKKITFDQVLLIEDKDNVLIGTPLLDKAQVIGEVIENFKDKKVIVFKKKRRKQYRRMKGHRQLLTRIKIEEIVPEGKAAQKKIPAEVKGRAKEEPKVSPAKVEKKEPVKAEKKPETKKVEKEPKKTASPKTKTKKAKSGVSTKKTGEKKAPAKKASTKKKKITTKKEK